jgi:colicin import membrane protein
MSRCRVPWSLLGAWLAAVVLVVPAGAEEFSLTRCIATGSGSDARLPSAPQQLDLKRHFACYEAQRAHEVRRLAKEAAERERQRRAAEEATRRQAEAAQAKETAKQAAQAKAQAKQAARQAALEKSKARQEAERARRADEAEAARAAAAQQEARRVQRAAQQPPDAEQFMPGACATPDLTAKCAMPRDPVLEQIRKSQENAARGRPSR